MPSNKALAIAPRFAGGRPGRFLAIRRQRVLFLCTTPRPLSLPRSGLPSLPASHLTSIRPTRDRQAERLVSYCAAKGYQVSKVVKEIASGVNDSRPKLLALLEDQAITLIVVEHRDRLTRFGFRYLDTLLKGQGRSLEVVNQAENETEDRLSDLTSIIYSFCARLYGQRRAKRKTEALVKALEAGEGTDATG